MGEPCSGLAGSSREPLRNPQLGRPAAGVLGHLGLTRFEFNILAWLAERPGRSVSRSDLAEHTLSDDSDVTERTVDTHISRIRKKLGADGALIATVWGIGYRFTPRAPR